MLRVELLGLKCIRARHTTDANVYEIAQGRLSKLPIWYIDNFFLETASRKRLQGGLHILC
jgi:hypothetical protein